MSAGLGTSPSGSAASASSSSACNTPSRKRVRKEEEWKSTQRKEKRNSGEAYVSKHGKQVQYEILCLCDGGERHKGSIYLC